MEIIDYDFDLVIAFPPCTHLASSGARWFPEKRADGRQQEGIDFFMKFVEFHEQTGVPVAIENPIGIMSTKYLTRSSTRGSSDTLRRRQHAYGCTDSRN
jgi:hypothetical protein